MNVTKRQHKSWYLGGLTGVLCILVLASGAFAAPVPTVQQGVAGFTWEETLRLGEKIYREGILPSGDPVIAIVQGDIPVEGTMFSCESCHMRAGIGSNEGGVVTPSTNGKILFQPFYTSRAMTPEEWARIPAHFRPPMSRPAYTEETLAAVLRDGIDSGGKVLDVIMPRYELSDRDMAILIAYLKSLSSEFSPGVTGTLRFATVIAGEVSPEDRAAMLLPLENYIRDRNKPAEVFETRAKYKIAEGMDLSYRRVELVRWELKGAPETWRRQLEEYYQNGPVFALIGGITYGDWQPVHEFSEEHRIPCIFPITDYPVISETDWYTLYLSKGVYQEGEAVARFLWREGAPDLRIVQIVENNRKGRALAAGFRETWSGLDRSAPMEITLRDGERVTKEFVKKIADQEKPSVILLWVGDDAVGPALETVAANTDGPVRIFIAASIIGQALWKLPEKTREFTYIAYPYRLPQNEERYALQAKGWLKLKKIPVDDRRTSTRMYTLVRILGETFMHFQNNYYRDYLLDAISMLQDFEYPDYERISFGPGQRYASKGCYIVRLTAGPRPEL